MREVLHEWVRDASGGAAAEFSLVLPFLLIAIFGTIDVGNYAWTINENEKATQAGARWAVATSPVVSGWDTYDYVGKTIAGVTYNQGDVIQASALGLISCQSSGCTYTAPTPTGLSFDSTSFNRIVARMKQVNPRITASNVVVEYRGSGLGYAGDPSGIEIAPLITVKLQNMTYSPLTLFIFKAAVPIPNAAYTLTMEDGQGTDSY